ncbi:MAG: transcriptional regulator, partial [Bacteroidales bacterium]|nr:transcriptional regulator [Bacteroidales bacterium]
IHYRGVQADYMLDHATHRLMVVPDREMDDFRRVFDLSLDEVTTERPLTLGACVKVLKGPLAGVQGRVVGEAGKWYVAVELMGVLYARARVPKSWLQSADL